MRFGLVFLAAVFAEVASLVLMGSWLGAPATFALLVLGFGLGFALLSGRGIATVKKALDANAAGESPGPALLDGALLAVAGVLFIVPGFASDVVAIVLALPPPRALIRRRVVRWMRARMPANQPGPTRAAGHVIDVDGHEVEQPDDDQLRLN